MREIFDFNSTMSDLSTMFDIAGFGRPVKIRFNTNGTKDMMPACWKVWEEKVNSKDIPDSVLVKKGYKAICRTVGINEEDIKITVEDYGICVEGKTVVEGTEYSQYMELPVSKSIMDSIKNIKYKSINGLTYVYLEVEEPEKKKINIEKI